MSRASGGDGQARPRLPRAIQVRIADVPRQLDALPGLHTQGDTLEEATANAEEALALYAEGLREEGRPIGAGIVRRKLPLPADGTAAGRLGPGRLLATKR